MSARGTQNAQLQGPQGSQDTGGACWWNIYAEGDTSVDGLNRH
jgi:hypothetical protein